MRRSIHLSPLFLASLACAAFAVLAEERHESFDREPSSWDARHNRSARPETVRQDFGWSPATPNAGGHPGEVGGRITPAAEPAYYAKRFPTRTFADPLAASGVVKVEKGGGHTLLGFFNAGTLNEWRTPNTIALRLQQRGEIFHCHLEYCTGRWRAGAGIIGRYDKARDRMEPKELPCGRSYTWSLRYDPNGNNGGGVVTATLDGDTAVCELSPQHKLDGAAFDHFGLVNVQKQYDGPGTLWLDDVTIQQEREDFTQDPHWDASGNRRTYETHTVRPRFDFGFTATRNAGGKSAGELGGLFFRGDCRYPDRLAAYGDRLGTLTLERPLRASGKVCLRRGVSDSTTLLGFYHSDRSLSVNPSQQFSIPSDFLGLAIEGPSGEGFYVYPVYRNHGGGVSKGMGRNPPRIYPDGATHNWTLDYEPGKVGAAGRITVSLDGHAVSLDLAPADQAAGAEFNRFGLVTPWIDGNSQLVFFDDLSYTSRQD